MGFLKIAAILISLAGLYFFLKRNPLPPVPASVFEDTWWGPGERPQKEDTSIRPFKVDVSKEILDDLKYRLDHALPFQPPLDGVNHHYGINSNLLTKIVDYWKKDYNWTQRQEFLNQYPHFLTKIQGLNIHFVHIKPKNVPQGVEVLPLLILHGYPGSFRLYYEISSILTRPQKGRNFVFEVIVPSLPGYAFSDGAVKPGLGLAQMGVIFNKLMKRLNFDRYYLQGEDWGSAISQIMAVLYPEDVIALHRSSCFDLQPHIELLIGTVFPSLFFTKDEIAKMYPLKEQIMFTLSESGYFHIQATKPDTVGVALRDSPVGLAAYIIEKYIAWTNRAFIDLPDGGLTKKFTYDQLLDNVMVYWINRSITTSVRIYAERFNRNVQAMGLDKYPVTVPTACPRFGNELLYSAEYLLKKTNPKLIHAPTYEDGGHFTAFELPEVVANDINMFVEKVRNLKLDKKDEL